MVQSLGNKFGSLFFLMFIYTYLFIWLCGVLATSCGSFIAVHGFSSWASVLGLSSCGCSAWAQ